jgi:hypothetical protein
MKRRPFKAAAAILVAAAVAVAIAVTAINSGGSDRKGPEARGQIEPGSGAQAPAANSAIGAAPKPPSGPVPSLAQRPRAGSYTAILGVRHGARLPLYVTPGGQLVDTVGDKTEFGSPRVFAVARQAGPWFGVITPLRPDGTLAWVRFDPAKLDLYWTRYSIRVQLAKRQMELRYGDRVLGRYTVTVGATGSSTPKGSFAITDALVFRDSPFYGCCALALSGHQSHLPVGWLGGDRIAIHGTPGPVGYAASHGCIRATDTTMRTLFRRVPLGAQVTVAG